MNWGKIARLALGAFTVASSIADSPITRGLIDYGRNRSGGGHDHRTYKGSDRTPSGDFK